MTSVVTPVVYLLALGVGLGDFVDRSANAAGRRSVPRVRRARAPGRDGDADRVVRGDLAGAWPRSSGRAVPRDVRDAAARARRHARPPGVLRVPRCSLTAIGLPRRHRRRSARSIAARRARRPGRGARRARRSRRRSPPGRRTREIEGLVRRDLPLRDPPDVPLLRDVLPDLAAPAPLEVVAWFTPLWHGVDAVPRPDARDGRVGDDLVPRRVPARVRDGRARSLARITYRREAVRLMTRARRRARLAGAGRPALGGCCIIERNVMVYRRTWMILFSGLLRAALLPLLLRLPARRVHRATSPSTARRSSTRRSSRRRCWRRPR